MIRSPRVPPGHACGRPAVATPAKSQLNDVKLELLTTDARNARRAGSQPVSLRGTSTPTPAPPRSSSRRELASRRGYRHRRPPAGPPPAATAADPSPVHRPGRSAQPGRPRGDPERRPRQRLLRKGRRYHRRPLPDVEDRPRGGGTRRTSTAADARRFACQDNDASTTYRKRCQAARRRW